MKKLSILLFCMLVFISLPVFENAAAAAAVDNPGDVPFIDLPAGHWAYKDIMDMKKLNIALGYSDNTFKPEKPMSRMEFIALFGRLTDKMGIMYEPDLYKDVDSFAGYNIGKSWAADEWRRLSRRYEIARPGLGNKDAPGLYMLEYAFGRYAAGNGADAGSGRPLLEGDILRGEAAALISPFLISDPDRNIIPVSIFKDIDECDFCFDIIKAHEYEILSGYPDGTFAPDKNITRAEAFALLSGFYGKSDFIRNSTYYQEYMNDLRIIFSNMMMDRYIDEAKTSTSFIPSYPADDFTDFRAMFQNVFMLEMAGRLDEAFKYYTMPDYVEYFDDLKEFYLKVPRNRLYDCEQACFRNAYKLFAEIVDIDDGKKLAHLKMVTRDEKGNATDYSLYKYLILYKGRWLIDFNGTSIDSGKYDDPWVVMQSIPDFLNFDVARYGISPEFP